ncbi:MAG TPA: TonB-dependent receptor [Rhodocyclaceae bacterium]|nr:TonB-dependent receptor [Rhodocyclaceae bacterium]
MRVDRAGRLRTWKTIQAVVWLALPNAVYCSEAVTPEVVVVGITPLPGLELAPDEIPSHVQSIGETELRDRRSATLPDLLESLAGVSVNHTTGNALQSDLSYRGFTASPLLGTPQGISVYQDGVRINEAFGDVLNWDSIPRAAIASVDLVPGSNPLFGLNTLGGAVSLTTKSGYSHSGLDVDADMGSSGHGRTSIEFGRDAGEFALYMAASRLQEDGWRDDSPARVNQLFAKLSHRRGGLELDLGVTGTDSDITGNGLVPETMLADRRATVFTKPDTARTRVGMVTLSSRYWLDDKARLSATTYYRERRARTLNGDINNKFEGNPAVDGAAGASGGVGVNADTAVNNRTTADQASMGVSVQWSRTDDDNHVAFGSTFDRSHTGFEQSSELGTFDSQRSVTAGGGGEVVDNRLTGTTQAWSLYATDTYRPNQEMAIMTSLRFNHARVATRDDLTTVVPNLDGNFTYQKLNPAIGVSWKPLATLSLFVNAAQGNRVPSPIELGCADPANPCSLPNAMQSDPYLKQVVTRTLESGLRGRAGGWQWDATLFRSINYDDILFVGTSTSAGYFTNFGRTRRQGLELGIARNLGTLALRANYAYVDATYQSSACLLAPENSSRGQSAECTASGQNDEILVKPGNRIPGIPRHGFKTSVAWNLAGGWKLTGDLLAFSSQYLRGNENNEHASGTYSDVLGGGPRTFLGSGRAPGYALVNVAANVPLGRRSYLSFGINNLTNRKYASAGALAANPFDRNGVFQTNSGTWSHESFFAPGAPRNYVAGLAFTLD